MKLSIDPSRLSGRLLSGILSQSLLRIVLAVSSIVLASAYLAHWGVDGYGDWLALTAIGSFASLSNLGLSQSSSTEMVKSVAAGDERTAVATLGTTLTVIALTAVIFLAVVGTLMAADLETLGLRIGTLSAGQAATVIICVIAQVFINMVRGLYAGALLCSGRYGMPNVVEFAARCVELACIPILIGLFHQSPVTVALLLTLTSSASLTVTVLLALRHAPWVRKARPEIDRRVIRKIAAPALGTLILQVGVGIVTVQGPRIVLNHTEGSALVAAYGLYYIASRLIDQASSLFLQVFQIEFSASAESSRVAVSVRLLGLGMRAVIVMSACAIVGIALFGRPLFMLWTHGHIAFSVVTACLFVILSAANQMYKPALLYLIGRNHVFVPSVLVLAFSTGGLLAGSLLAQAYDPLRSLALGLLASELCLVIIINKITAGSLGVRLSVLLRSFFAPSAYVADARMFRMALAAILRRLSRPEASAAGENGR